MSSEPVPNPLRDDDVQALIGTLGIIDAELMAGELDDDLVERLTRRLVQAALLRSEPDGGLPSPGRLLRAMEDLDQRLRYARGEYDSEPTPASGPTLHDLDFSSLEDARSCLERLPQGQLREPQIHRDQDRWRVGVCYPELPPDEDFKEREASLRGIAIELRGHYQGSQSAPPDN